MNRLGKVSPISSAISLAAPKISIMSKRVWLLSGIFLLLLTAYRDQGVKKEEQIFQVSTLPALSAGGFDGITPYPRLHTLGDFGLGTFDQLDGEMVALDGTFYQVRADGVAHPVAPTAKAPFADVTFFKADRIMEVAAPLSYEQLSDYLLQALPDPDAYYAIRIDGAFQTLRVRSVPPQQKPYPTLAEAIDQQVVFDYDQIEGTMVGFYMPAATADVGIPGFHFHFISKDKTRGGHVLNVQLEQAQIAVDDSDGLALLKGNKRDKHAH